MMITIDGYMHLRSDHKRCRGGEYRHITGPLAAASDKHESTDSARAYRVENV